jgi:glycosyltransferase involved in cell wall biosynthesis
MQQSISAIILTYNEEKHIARCIQNVRKVAEHIYVIDSFSFDKTCEIASKLGANVIQHEFVNQAQQLQWALDTIKIASDWILRLDADEYLSDQLISEINETIPSLSKDITGCDIPRDVVFMGKHLKWGKVKSIRLLRLWRNGAAYVEQRWMDEHCILKYGNCHHLKSLFFDDNINGLTEWTNKHNKYANREVVVMLSNKYNFGIINADMKQRNSRKNVYYSSPLYIRAIIYFFARYVLLLGFLDGIPGLVWHTLQAYWYRFLIDSKISEMYHVIGKNPTKEDIGSYVKDAYNIDL